MTRPLLLLAVSLAVALAGCAGDNASPTPTTATGTPTSGTPATSTPATTPSTPADDAEAQRLYQSAVSSEPERFGMRMVVTKNGTEMMVVDGAFDEAANRTAITIRGDPAAFPEEASDPSTAALLRAGVSIYATEHGAAYVINDTAFVFSQDGSVPVDPEESPVGRFVDRDALLEGLSGPNVTASDARPVTWKGRAATQMTITGLSNESDENVTGTAIVYNDPPRLARIEADVPDRDGGEDDPLAGGRMALDFLYDAEAGEAFPESARRAFGLAYTGGAFGGFGGSGGFGGQEEDGAYRATWNFTGDADIPLGEVEAQVKDAADAFGDPTGIGAAPTLWSMRLSEGAKSQDGVNLTFVDADGSGTVSPGDTLRIEAADGEAPTVVLYDTVTGMYVVPGLGPLALAALLGLVSLALRRK